MFNHHFKALSLALLCTTYASYIHAADTHTNETQHGFKCNPNLIRKLFEIADPSCDLEGPYSVNGLALHWAVLHKGNVNRIADWETREDELHCNPIGTLIDLVKLGHDDDLKKLIIEWDEHGKMLGKDYINGQGPNYGNTPLHYATKHSPTIIEFLLSRKADCKRPNRRGLTPLEEVCHCDFANTPNGYSNVIALATHEKNNKNIVANNRTIHGTNPLHYLMNNTTIYGDALCTLITTLRDAGYDTYAQDKQGYSPINYAFARQCDRSVLNALGVHIFSCAYSY